MSVNRKVLIIDDEIDLCLLLKSYFTKKNYEVYLAHTLDQGISFLETLKPDILFLDNNLPDGIGWAEAPRIAQEFPETYINLISAFHPNMPDMPENSRFRIVEKPIKMADLEHIYSSSQQA